MAIRYRVFDRVTLVALAVASCVLTGLIVFRIYDRMIVARTDRTNPPLSLQAGQLMPRLDRLSYHDAARTAVLLVNTANRDCIDSMPFYRRLREETRLLGLRFVAVSRESAAGMDAFFKQHNVGVDLTIQDAQGVLPTRDLPTLLIVDREGRLVRGYPGRLSAQQERDALSTVTGSQAAGGRR